MPTKLMLATLSDRREFGDDWLLERKLDGERCVAHKQGAEVRLESRTGKDLSGTYPEVRDAIAAQEAETLLLDGEVVAYDGEQTSFSRLQQRLGTRSPSAQQIADAPVVYCVFDLLEVGGEDLRGGRSASGATTRTRDPRERRAAADRGLARRLRARGSTPPAAPAGRD